jgi:hypothetical protein
MTKSTNGTSTVTRGQSKRQTLDSWIAEALADPDKFDRDGKPVTCRMISLAHMKGANGQVEVHSILVGEGSGKTPKLLAALFEGKAQSYAQDLAGIQSFNLLAFYGESLEAQAYHPFSISGEAFHPGLSTEAPNAEGITQMLMRHVEIKEKLHVQERVTIFDALLQTVDFLSKANQKLSEDNAEAFTIMKEIMLEKTLNQHDLRLKELAFARSTSERDKMIKIAPMLVNTVAGKEVFPQGAADTALLEAIAEVVDPAVLATVMSSGGFADRPEIAGLVAARFSQIAEKKQKEKERIDLLASQARVKSETLEAAEADAAGDVEP